MQQRNSLLAYTFVLLLASSAVLADSGPELERVGEVDIPLDTVRFAGTGYDKTFNFQVGVGSGAFRHPADPAGVVYTVSDRGVNIDCEDDLDLIGADICTAGKIFPVPNFAPSIYRFEESRQKGKGWRLTQIIQFKDSQGFPISGLSNPFVGADTEAALDASGAVMDFDPNGLDTESLARLSDGSFWLGEEYGPSIVHVSATGEVLERLVPAGIEADLAGARYPVSGSLPAILAKRKLNRGIESIAVSNDERTLYFILQSPLANPDEGAYKNSRNVRLFSFDLGSGTVTGEYVYVLDLPGTFTADSSTKQTGVKVSELTMLPNGKLMVLERISKTTKLYTVDFSGATDILGSGWDDAATAPSLEKQGDLAAAGIVPLAKTLVFDSALSLPGLLPSKLEGVAVLDREHLLLVNDSDFGIEGDTTYFSVVEMGEGIFE
jgi:Uncharacterized protein conserved in bacteria